MAQVRKKEKELSSMALEKQKINSRNHDCSKERKNRGETVISNYWYF